MLLNSSSPFMKKIKPLLIILICAGALVSGTFCNVKKNICPGYSNDNLFQWFPYSKGQVITFKSTTNETASIIIETVTKSEGYTDKVSSTCVSKGSISSASTSKLKFEVTESFEGGTYSHHVTDRHLFFRSLTLYPVDINDSGVALKDNWLSLYHTGFSTPSGTYDLTEEIYTSDTAAARKSGTARLFISKNKGIVGYTTYPDSTNWWLQ